MTATDELRRMLDERGVEHYDGTERTLWGYEQTGEDTGIYRFAASEISGGFLQFNMFRITPAQAIAATLGRGECHDDSEVEVIFECSECGCNHLRHRAFVDLPRYCPNCGRKVVDA